MKRLPGEEGTEVQDNTELGREFGKKDCSLRCVLQRGVAGVPHANTALRAQKHWLAAVLAELVAMVNDH